MKNVVYKQISASGQDRNLYNLHVFDQQKYTSGIWGRYSMIGDEYFLTHLLSVVGSVRNMVRTFVLIMPGMLDNVRQVEINKKKELQMCAKRWSDVKEFADLIEKRLK